MISLSFESSPAWVAEEDLPSPAGTAGASSLIGFNWVSQKVTLSGSPMILTVPYWLPLSASVEISSLERQF